MNEQEFLDWVDEYCPSGVDPNSFVIGLAIGTVKVIEACSVKMNEPIPDILMRFKYDFKPS